MLEGDVPSPANPPSACRFHTRCPFATEVCSADEPAFVDYGGGHWAACHHPSGRPHGAGDSRRDAGAHAFGVIARVWRGTVRRGDAATYADYIRATGFGAYGETEGNRGAWLLQRDFERDREELTEFVTYSLWENWEAIRAFAGPEPEVAVLYPEDKRFLVEGGAGAAHFDVIDET